LKILILKSIPVGRDLEILSHVHFEARYPSF
jgi:hypothetical protein